MRTRSVLVLGGSLVLAALLLGIFFYTARVGDDTIAIVGAATQHLESDVIKWRIWLRRNVGPSDLTDGYRRIKSDVGLVEDMLRESGVAEGDVTVQPVTTQERYNREGVLSSYDLNQGLFVISKDIGVVEELALNPLEITDQGVIIGTSSIEYLYSGLDELKLAMLAAATENARRRAEEITRNSGAAVGKVTSLRAGVFQIREPFSTEVRSYGMYSTQTRQKEITVTVHATFGIK
jgi:hypothetical protein